MGCVLGTEAAGDRRRSVGAGHRRRSIEAPSGVEAVRDDRKEAVARQRENHTGDFPAIERRKPFPANQQGWPSWLLAVAGDAIQGWTPRRANTFEKLAKVLKIMTLTLRVYLIPFRFLKKYIFCSDWARDL